MKWQSSLAGLLAGVAAAQATTIFIASPDTAQTFTYGSVSEHRLFWNGKEGRLYAYLRFCNRPYDSGSEPPAAESFLFALPGIKLDAVSGTFYAETRDGRRVPVAEWRGGWPHRRIVPSEGTLLVIARCGGRASVCLFATDEKTERGWAACSWASINDNWSLQNLVCDLIAKRR
ncbi:MAG: hypothetical protein N2689_01660 [Verrucomicrobiae bacterium]|nr:hypothetical protein [Verrucomicrobiae bacterium]